MEGRSRYSSTLSGHSELPTAVLLPFLLFSSSTVPSLTAVRTVLAKLCEHLGMVMVMMMVKVMKKIMVMILMMQ